jgi:hypothetical protein
VKEVVEAHEHSVATIAGVEKPALSLEFSAWPERLRDHFVSRHIIRIAGMLRQQLAEMAAMPARIPFERVNRVTSR